LTGAPINLVTGGEYDLVFDESMVEGTGDNRKKKFNTVVYAIQEIPSTQSETVKVTSVNPKYYDKMALFMAYRNREGKRFADRTPDGRIAIMTPDPPPADATPTERREYDEALQRSLALTKVMNDEDFYVEEEVDGYRVYENNPTKYVLQLTNAAEVFIDMANLNDPLSQMIHSSVLTALDKGQLSPQDLWDDAVTKFGTRPSFPTELPGSR
jgi:hypothetical protein